MPITMPITNLVLDRVAEITAQLLHTQQLREAGCSGRMLAARVQSGELVKLRRGWYIPSQIWSMFHAEDRQLALIHIAHADASLQPVFSHYSAAALHGFPLDDRIAPLAHVLTPANFKGGVFGGCARHRVEFDTSELIEVGPYLCTTPERTVSDLALFAPTPLALSCADSYLRKNFRAKRAVDEASVSEWRNLMQSKARRLAGGRGVRNLRWVGEFADARADSPLESVSRFHLIVLGIEFEIQVAVRSPSGGFYFVDFEFPKLGLFGECDGKMKYLDERLLQGMTAAERVYSDKRRTDWISGRERKSFIRWGWPDVYTTRRFATRLHAFGVPIPKIPQGLILPARAA